MDLVTNLRKQGLLHAYIWNEEGFVFDPTTNSVFSCLEQDVLDIQNLNLSSSFLDEIQELVSQGYFCKEDPLNFQDTRIFKSLCLMITRDCNFRCPYCFEKGKTPSSTVMSPALVEKALWFLVHESGNRKYLECDFFGGEPLLGWETIQHAVETAEEIFHETGKLFRFSLTTNAFLLTPEQTDYLKNHHVSLILSQDGRPSTQNRFRILPDGRPTYTSVMSSILPIVQTWTEGYYVRGTFTRQNIHFIKDVQHLYKIGVKKISFEPVVSNHPSIGFTREDLPSMREEYQLLTKWYLDIYRKDPTFSFYHFEIDLSFGACKEKLITSCGAGTEYLSVSPEGDLYPCHQFDGLDAYKMGSLAEGITNQMVVATFQKATNLFSKKECTTCWARYLCGGGCSANNQRMQGDILHPWALGCDIQKMRIEAALVVQTKKKELLTITS